MTKRDWARLSRQRAAENLIAKNYMTREDFDDDWRPIPAVPKFVTRDSGSKSVYADGMQRDATTGKPMFRLMFPKGVPYAEQLITRVAALYERGARKYGDRNWEKSCTEESLAHHEDSFLRHVFEFLTEVDDGEDHAAAVVWNVNAILLTRRNITAKAAEDPVVRLGQESVESHVAKRQAEEHPVRGGIEQDPAAYAQPDYPTAVAFLKFASGDQVTDVEEHKWVHYEDGSGMLHWRQRPGFTVCDTVGALARHQGPLHVDTGAFAGINIQVDGSVTH